MRKDEGSKKPLVNSIPPSLSPLHPFDLEAMKGVEPLSFGLQDRRSVSQLSYIAKELLVSQGT